MISPADAAAELLARRRARESFPGFCEWKLRETDFKMAPHHRVIAEALDDVERGECDRLMLMLPPGSAKSTYASVFFPEYFLGRNPQLQVISASHTVELAEAFGRRVRNAVEEPGFKTMWNVQLAGDNAAAGRWATDKGGQYFAVGVGGSVTGRRGDCLLGNTMVLTYNGPTRIDQVKPGQHVLSQYQNRPAYRRVAAVARRQAVEYFRIHTASGCVVEATGNHRVFVGGVWKEASSVVAGDVLMRVLRQGVQPGVVRVGEEGSGKYTVSAGVQPSVRYAAEQRQSRHAAIHDMQQLRSPDEEQGQNMLGCLPFEVGSGVWSAQANGAGAAVHHLRQGLSTCEQRVRVEVLLDEVQERFALDDHAAAEQPDVEGWGHTQTGEACAEAGFSGCQKAGLGEGRRDVRGVQLRREAGVPSHQWQSAGQSAPELGDAVRLLPRTTSCDGKESTTIDFVSMVERVRCEQGVDVYDIEVDGAHNFYANDILVHNCIIVDDPVASREDADSDRIREKTWQWWTNDLLTRLKPGARIVFVMTRWHEDDLAGRILDAEREKWRVIKIPMLAGPNDVLGRREGERLWPEWFTDQMMEQAQQDPRSWISLYQQEPRPAEGAEFKRTWIQRYNNAPKTMNKVILVDPAGAKGKTSDYTSMWVVGLGGDENAYVIDGLRDRLNLTERTNALFELHRKHKPMQVRYERYGAFGDIEHIKSEMERRQYRFPMQEVGGQVQKEARIRRLIPWFEGGRIWLPHEMIRTTIDGKPYDVIKDFVEQEYASFPVARHDDAFDCLARLAEPKLSLPWPKEEDYMGETNPLWSVLDNVVGY